jgi:hypothetical protein
MKNIVCFHLFNDFSGSPQVLRTVVEGLLDKGYSIDLITSRGGVLDGLKGNDIPIAAQAVALADVYDALVSDRCYRKGYTHSEAIHMIQSGQCGQFNPDMIQCLLKVEKQLQKRVWDNDDYLNVLTEKVAGRE